MSDPRWLAMKTMDFTIIFVFENFPQKQGFYKKLWKAAAVQLQNRHGQKLETDLYERW